MSEQLGTQRTPGPVSESPRKGGFGSLPGWVVALLALIVVALFVVPMILAPKHNGTEGEAFGGTDAKVTEQLQEQGHEPWFEPLFEPGSGEIESGLFAMQAALGGIVFGYVIGRLHGRRKRETAPGTGPTQLP